jgi:pimeloyl-ACP methyl ester carboxylesterase
MTTEHSVNGCGGDGGGGINDTDLSDDVDVTFLTTASSTAASHGFASFLAKKHALSTRLYMSTSGDATGEALSASSPTSISKAVPQVHPECPLLYKIPSDLHRYYRPLPILVQTLTVILAAWMAALSTWTKLTWWQPLSILRGIRPLFSWNRLAMFVIKTITYSLLSQVVLQEIFTRPSRVSMDTLTKQYFLPSKLSKYETITVRPLASSSSTDEHEAPFSLGVHYLKYDNPQISTANIVSPIPKFDALYLQHGFGASSLSWLPAIPSLVHRLGARMALGHDAVGFGFTQRPKDQEWYTSRQSARIAQQILEQNSDPAEEENSSRAVALMGHSMGSLAMLRLATHLPKDTPKFIILSSPALGINHRKPPRSSAEIDNLAKIRRKTLDPVGRAAQQVLFFPVAKYLLRRVVGTHGSWRFGLKAAWGDPAKVTDGDVLRFSWPAIGLGWEKGILKFVSAQSLPQEDELDDDEALMKRVLELPNTRVAIILGSKDRIVTPNLVRRFMNATDPEGTVPIIELQGLGHDAFEEDEKIFCDTVERLLKSRWLDEP